MTCEAKSFIEGLLQLDVNRRLGGFSANADPIKAHPFLADIVWEDVAAKRMAPPFIPAIQGHEDVSHFDTNWTSDVTEVGKVIDASLFDHVGCPATGPASPASPVSPGGSLEADELHINNFEYTSPDLSRNNINGANEVDESQFVIE